MECSLRWQRRWRWVSNLFVFLSVVDSMNGGIFPESSNPHNSKSEADPEVPPAASGLRSHSNFHMDMNESTSDTTTNNKGNFSFFSYLKPSGMRSGPGRSMAYDSAISTNSMSSPVSNEISLYHPFLSILYVLARSAALSIERGLAHYRPNYLC